MNVLAYTDAVTGLPNRAVITHIFSLAQQQPAELRGAMVFIDLDGFKRVNDTLGHDAGDDLLRQVAQRIVARPAHAARGSGQLHHHLWRIVPDLPHAPGLCPLCRDEFLLLLPGRHDRATLDAIATRIRAALEDAFNVFNNEVFISASMGWPACPKMRKPPSNCWPMPTSPCIAPRKGKNAHVFFDASLKGKVEERAHIERELHHAVDGDTLDLALPAQIRCRPMR
jgi:two-component system CheB/CheR fusion protein